MHCFSMQVVMNKKFYEITEVKSILFLELAVKAKVLTFVRAVERLTRARYQK